MVRVCPLTGLEPETMAVEEPHSIHLSYNRGDHRTTYAPGPSHSSGSFAFSDERAIRRVLEILWDGLTYPTHFSNLLFGR